MIKPYNLTAIFIILFPILFLCASCAHLNDGHEDNFNQEGCPIERTVQTKVGNYSVDLFLETSGSMFGFMPASKKTSFQTGLWNVITALKDVPGSALALHQIRSKNERVYNWNADEFRSQLNSGQFQSAKSTDIPQMIDSLLSKNKHEKVSILVSDLIFSPEDGSPALLDQITPDIRTRFINKGYAVDLIQKTSEFYKRAGTLVPSSPYYYWIIGPKGMVADVIAHLRQVLGTYNELSFGLDPSSIPYSILPFALPNESALPINCAAGDFYYVFGSWDGSDTPFQLKIAANFSALSSDMSTAAYLQANLTAESADGKVRIDSVGPAASGTNQTDQHVLKTLQATNVLTLTVKDIQNNDAFISLNLKRDLPGWVDESNLEIDDNLRTKTCGLKKMVEGLEEAFHPSPQVFGQPMIFLITKNSN